MDIRRSDQIIALKMGDGEIIGFHSSNLEVAELSEELWETLTKPGKDIEAEEQLQSWNEEVSPDVRSEKLRSQIQSLSINVTQLCNLQCVYCAAGGDGTYGNPQKKISVEKTIPQIELLMNRLTEGESFHITFLGGEPLLYAQGMKLIAEYAQNKAQERSLKLKFNTITNGTLFTEENIAILRSFHSNITLSLDGPPEINDQVRPSKGQKGVTAQILQGLQRLNRNRESLGTVGVQGVFGPSNSNPLNSYLFYRGLGVDWYDFHFDQESNDLTASDQFAQEMAQVAQAAFEFGGETELRKIKFFDQIFDQLDSKKRIENYCGSGKTYLVLDAQNRAFVCPWAVNDASLAVGNGTDLSLEKLQPLKNSLISTNNCGNCWARYLCGGGCMWAHKKATGHQHQVDIVFCDRTRALISTGISYYYQLRKALS
jgi:uncharacterized protein